MTFLESSTWAPIAPGRLEGHLGEDWSQGRAVYGGILMAGALRGLQGLVPENRPLRAVMASFLVPVAPGPFLCEVEVLRSGSSFTHTVAQLYQRDRLCMQLMAGFGTARPPGLVVPPAVAPAELHPGQHPVIPHIPGITPEFIRHFDVAIPPDFMPFSGREDPQMRCWLREANSEDLCDAVKWVALMDVPPPPVWTGLRKPARGSTIHFQATVLADGQVEVSGRDWVLFDAQVNTSDGNYCDYQYGLWGPDGTQLAIGKQVFADFSGQLRT